MFPFPIETSAKHDKGNRHRREHLATALRAVTACGTVAKAAAPMFTSADVDTWIHVREWTS